MSLAGEPEKMRLLGYLIYVLFFWFLLMLSGGVLFWLQVSHGIDTGDTMAFYILPIIGLIMGAIFAFSKGRRFYRKEKWSLCALCIGSVVFFFGGIMYLFQAAGTSGFVFADGESVNTTVYILILLLGFLVMLVLLGFFAGLGTRLVVGFRAVKPKTVQDVFE